MEFISAYSIAVLVFGLTGLLLWLQLVIFDVSAIKAKHVPGFDIEQNHHSFLFRSHRVFANTNESVGIFILMALFSILSLGEPAWVNGLALVYLFGRIAHMIFYYSNVKLLRSIAFTVSFLAVFGLFCVGIIRWI